MVNLFKLLIFFFVVHSGALVGQVEMKSMQLTESFKPFYEDESIHIEVRKTTCGLPGANFTLEMVLLKVVNLTDNPLTIDLGVSLVYDSDCVNCDDNSPEHLKAISVQPKSALESSCSEMLDGLSYTIRANHGLDDRIFEVIRLTTLNKY